MAYADTPKGAGINNGYAFDGAKVQIKNVSCKYFGNLVAYSLNLLNI